MTKQRRQFSAEFKVRVVLEMISGEKGLMQASREYEIKDTVLSRWKQEFFARRGCSKHQRRGMSKAGGLPSWRAWSGG